MTRKEQLEFCNKCSNRKFDPKSGIICGLTNKPAEFEENCKYFIQDKGVQDLNSEDQVEEIVSESIVLDESTIIKLKSHQDFYYAIVGGLLATIISAVTWAAITVATEMQIGFMAIGVGILVGYTVQFFGAGIDKKFGYLGAGLSLLGCLLGNLLSQVGFIANQESLGYFETLTYLNPNLIITIFAETFSPMDLLFYGIATYEGYKFSFRKVTTEVITRLINNDTTKDLSNYRLRMPLVIISIVLLTFVSIKVSLGYSGHKIYTYDSGKTMSEGDLYRSKQHGNWTFYFENGNKQTDGFYRNGSRDSIWNWYREDGSIESTGSYKYGLENGVWKNYYENGRIADSGFYENTRMVGQWRSWYENGSLKSISFYKDGIPDSIWISKYENGQVSGELAYKEGSPLGIYTTYFENGQLSEQVNYDEEGIISILNVYSQDGSQLVKDGNGIYKGFDPSGQLRQEGKVEGGLKTGSWISYHENGLKSEEGIFEGEVYRVLNYWDRNGIQTVKDGFGSYKSFLDGDTIVIESGEYNNGNKTGIWTTYYPSSGEIFQESHLQNGKINGKTSMYYINGLLQASGEMINDQREGDWIWYHPTGGISSVATFVNGKKEGKQLLYDLDGNEVREEIYKSGVRIKEVLKR
jgi:antitoxin component YwqK of YwqJK toxin-antitoxin module